jgi:GTP:adenosylcobinamide-phosphate guanylyltransferase
MKSPEPRLIIIPAAGFGTRMGSPEAKEMLPRPAGVALAGEPLIAWSLSLAKLARANVHVIVRPEKKSLIDYLNTRYDLTISLQMVGSTKEWPETLLQSEPFWQKNNLVLLPDVDFAPQAIVDDLFCNMEAGASDLVFATIEKNGYRTWGVVDKVSCSHCEKPLVATDSACAWGIFGFQKEFGKVLLQQMLESTFDHHWWKLPGRTDFFNLERFEDLTRER